MSGDLLLDDGDLVLWGFQLRRPNGWWVEVPGSTRDHRGEIRLQGPRGMTLALAWGHLGDARRRFPAPANHMEACLQHLGTMIKADRLVTLHRRAEEVRGDPLEVASVEILPRGGWLGRSHQAMAAVVHCKPRNRFYTLCTHPYPVPDREAETAFRQVLAHFRCH